MKGLLAAFAIGGEQGTPVEFVANALGFPVGDVYQAMAQLALGGVVYDLGNGVLCVLPEPLRSAIIADYFFNGPVAVPLQPLLAQLAPSVSICKALINAQFRGASISSSQILPLLKHIDDVAVWEEFVWSGEENATIAYKCNPELVGQCPNAFLRRAPAIVLPYLLRAAIADDRELHSHPDHPLRMIDDWIKSSPIGNGAAFDARVTLWKCIRDWFEKDGDQAVCLRALISVVTPEFESSEQDAGDRNRFMFRRACVSATDLTEIAGLWPEIVVWLSKQEISNWAGVLDAVDEWVYAGRVPSPLSTSQNAIFEEAAKSVLFEISRIAIGRPAVLSALKLRASHIGLSLGLDIDTDFAILFPDDPCDDDRGWEICGEEQSEAVRNLAAQWQRQPLAEVVTKLVWCVREASALRRVWPDHSQWICALLAEQVADPERWLSELLNHNVSANHLLPFLQVITQRQQGNWLDTVISYLRTPSLTGAALTVLLASPDQSDAIEQEIIEKSREWPKLVDVATMRGQVPQTRLARLLNDTDSGLAAVTADGMWLGRKDHPIPSDLFESWRRAIIHGRISEHHIAEMFTEDAELAFAWLLDRSNSDRPLRVSEEVAVAAVAAVSMDQRRLILQSVASKGYFGRILVSALVGTSADLFRLLLNDPSRADWHLEPLRSMPSDEWVSLALIALDAGHSVNELNSLA